MNDNLVPLIKRAKAGDEKAMSLLYESFKPLIIKNSINQSRSLNQDCLQELSAQFVLAVHMFNLEKYLEK